MLRGPMLSTFLKRLPSPVGSDRSHAPKGHAHRVVVAGRSPGGPEERHHTAMGQAWDSAVSAQGSAHHVGVHLWRDLPRRGQGGWPGAAALQYRRHDAPPRRDIRRRRAGSARRVAPRSSRMARLKGAGRSQQYHTHAAAAQMSRAQPGRERLAVHARQLAVEPRLQILRRHPRSLLLRLEPPHRSAMAHRVTRTTVMGSSVLIRESWYNPFRMGFSLRLARRGEVIDMPQKRPDDLCLVNVADDQWKHEDVNVHRFGIERLSDLEYVLQLRSDYA